VEPRTPGLERLGPYRVERELGRGGQGVVYLARDVRLGRTVALKVLPAGGSSTQLARRRFWREVRAVSRLDHPSLCAVYDAGTEGDLLWIAMRHVEGRTLAARLRDPAAAREPLATSLELIERAARALHVAHEAGVVHRDVKPGNLMVTAAGEPVLLDFGLARDDESFALLTRTGDWLGTPAYMSPEQVSGARVDRRSDVWSLGATLYECVALRPPFEGDAHETLFDAILRKPPREPRRRLPADLKVVLGAALEKDPDRRYQTALDLAEDLRRLREHRPVRARPVGPLARLARWSRRNPVVAGGLASIVLSLTTALAISLYALRSTRAALVQEESALREATRESDRAVALGREIGANLGAWERLADTHRLEQLIRESEEHLWPAWPRTIPAMDAWLERARPVAGRLPEHRAALESLRARGRRTQAAGGAEDWEFDDHRDRWQHDVLAPFVAALTTFAESQQERRTLSEVVNRRKGSADVVRLTIENHQEAWTRARREVAEDPRTGAVRLNPLVGLVPLGRDPESGLQEFADLLTGEVPVRNPRTGRLAIGPKTGIVLVLVPGGTFRMGAQADDPGAPNHDPAAAANEKPVREITLAPFLLSKYEMTQAQWRRLSGRNPSAYPKDLMMPVEAVSWRDCDGVLRRPGMELPTEAQWEYACRAGASTPWWTGGEVTSMDGGGQFQYRAAEDPEFGSDKARGAVVGEHRPNAFGLHDVQGNVREWCRDRHGSYELPVQAGDGLREGPGPKRVIRGTDCLDHPAKARSAARSQEQEGYRQSTIGVRPARRLF
jgi:formylglycine-generating enzyme required for sulfatase activity/predicted Ser/Thr protein kinase